MLPDSHLRSIVGTSARVEQYAPFLYECGDVITKRCDAINELKAQVAALEKRISTQRKELRERIAANWTEAQRKAAFTAYVDHEAPRLRARTAARKAASPFKK